MDAKYQKYGKMNMVSFWFKRAKLKNAHSHVQNSDKFSNSNLKFQWLHCWGCQHTGWKPILYTAHWNYQTFLQRTFTTKFVVALQQQRNFNFFSNILLKVKTKSDEIPLTMYDNFTNCIELKVPRHS